MDFITYKGSVSWTNRNGEERGTTDQVSFKLAKAEMETPSGLLLEILQHVGQDWEGHTIDGVATTSYLDFQNKLKDATA